MPSADFMDIKKYQIEVGKHEERSVSLEEAVEQIESHENDVTQAIQSIVNE